jgi:hypothetical protein
MRIKRVGSKKYIRLILGPGKNIYNILIVKCIKSKVKVKQSLYMPWRRLGG